MAVSRVKDNEEQRRAAESRQEDLMVIAPPGCGKTEILARRAGVLIERLLPHQRILALTFSNKARLNLRDRLRRHLGTHRFQRLITVRNFHGHAAELLRAHAHTIGQNAAFPMPGKRSLIEAIQPFIRGLSIDAALRRKAEIERALRLTKQEPIDDSEVMRRLIEYGDEHACKIEAARQEAGILYYDDLLRHAQRLLQVAEVGRLYQQHYGAVLVDEFQDLSMQQLDIAVRSALTNRMFVGDPLQGIYTWAGAHPEAVERKLRDLCGEPLELSISYRSSPRVLTAVNKLSASMGGQNLQSAEPQIWPGGGAAAAITFETEKAEAEWIVQISAELIRRRPLATVGIITRAAWRRKPVDRAFAASTVPFIQWDLAIENPEIVERLRSAARRLPKYASIEELERKVVTAIESSDVETYDDAIEALDQLRGIVNHAGSLSAAFAQLKVRDPDRSVPPGIHLLNAHTGKGQQFDWVFVPGFEDFHIPSGRSTSAAERAEEKRVLLVMLSRARHGLVITRATWRVAKSGREYRPDESPWWTTIADSCPMDATALKSHIDTHL